jgi:dUTP pyrophosphatase
MSYIDATEAPPTHAILHMYVEDSELRHKYEPIVTQFNIDSLTNTYPNAGFDLFFPETTLVENVAPSTMVSMGVKMEMKIYDTITNEWKSTGYYMYPRSSISKTPLMVANCTGVIDSGYRGNITGAFRNLSGVAHPVQKHSRLLQICSPDLRPMVVKIVEKSFFEETSRASGGFGSTGV